MSVAPGRSIFEMIRDTADAADRTAALGDLHQAVGAAATALAELHGRPEGTGGPVDTGFLRFNHGLARREAAAVAEFGERLSALRIDPDGMVTRVAELLDAGLAEPGGASLMHGDAHPGNLFWDPSHGITLIDAPHAHFAMDQAGRPIGTPARDYANMMERLAHFGYEAGLSSPEVAALQTNFAETYAAMGGPPIPEAAVAAFTIRFALRDVLDTLTALRTIDQADSPFRAVRQETRMLREQLRTELGLLRRALGWTHE
jgi:aminoglycoside phosphotransferase (APT) family kinase protein